jgi:hypothetical protein
MKTPRDILLKHHQNAQSRLDAIRHAALATIETQPAASISLREILRSLRWHLAGMSAVWLLVLILRADTNPAPQLAATIPARIPPAQVMIASVREHRRQLSEMAGAYPPDGERRELFVPKPRSELRREMLMA